MTGEEPEVPFSLIGPMPQLGYFIEDLESEVSFCHLGDNNWAYPEMAAIGGTVDILFLSVGKMGLEEDAKALDYMRPKVVIPIHWRYPDNDYPVPHLYQRHEPPDQQIRGHHFPYPGDPPVPGQPHDPLEYIEELTELADERGIKVVQVKAGMRWQIR